jgi:hypothetical protein
LYLFTILLCTLLASEIVNGIKWSEALNEEFLKNEKADPSIAWQYFASNTGFMRVYPG